MEVGCLLRYGDKGCAGDIEVTCQIENACIHIMWYVISDQLMIVLAARVVVALFGDLVRGASNDSPNSTTTSE